MNRTDAKKYRAEIANKKRKLRRPVVTIYTAIYLMIGHDRFVNWIDESKGFSGLLRIFAKDWFGNAEDVSQLWERSICQVLSDLAEKEMTNKEWLTRDISTPALLVEWFADYLEKMFSKNELSWESKLFSPESLEPVINELTVLEKNYLNNGSAQSSTNGDKIYSQ